MFFLSLPCISQSFRWPFISWEIQQHFLAKKGASNESVWDDAHVLQPSSSFFLTLYLTNIQTTIYKLRNPTSCSKKKVASNKNVRDDVCVWASSFFHYPLCFLCSKKSYDTYTMHEWTHKMVSWCISCVLFDTWPQNIHAKQEGERERERGLTSKQGSRQQESPCML